MCFRVNLIIYKADVHFLLYVDNTNLPKIIDIHHFLIYVWWLSPISSSCLKIVSPVESRILMGIDEQPSWSDLRRIGDECISRRAGRESHLFGRNIHKLANECNLIQLFVYKQWLKTPCRPVLLWQVTLSKWNLASWEWSAPRSMFASSENTHRFRSFISALNSELPHLYWCPIILSSG